MPDGSPPTVSGARSTASKTETADVYGGLTLAGLAAVALAISFYHPGPLGFFGTVMWPRAFSLLILLGGLGMAGGQLQVRNKQDFIGGIALIAVAIVALQASIDLPGMRGFAFGPGTAPRLFAIILGTLGILVAITGLVTDGPEGQRYTLNGITIAIGTVVAWCLLAWPLSYVTPNYAQAIATLVVIVGTFAGIGILDQTGMRGPFFITLSVFSFGIFIRPLGLVIAGFLCVIICAGASPDVRWRETIIWGIILTAFCSFLFPYGLNLPFQLWPRFWFW